MGQGTGLGLSIVRKIIDEHKGQILVDSKPGVGTRITLGFPVNREVAKRPEEPAEIAAADAGDEQPKPVASGGDEAAA